MLGRTKRYTAVFLAVFMCFSMSAPVCAGVVKKGAVSGSETGSGGSSGSSSQNKGRAEEKNADGAPGTITLGASVSAEDLEKAIRKSGMDALGTGNTPADPILDQVQIANYFLKDAGGNDIDFVATNENRGAVAKEGFSKFYMIHDGVARFYYRTYSDAHGWTPWCIGKQTTPYNEDGTKIQAIQIRVKGYARTLNDLYYKVVLNDGTVLDWAKNGQTAGTMGTDRYIVAIRVGLWNRNVSFPYSTENLMAGCKYEGTYTGADGVIRYSSYNDVPYTGWGLVDNTQYYFANGEYVTGWQYIDGYKYYFNDDGTLATDLEPVMGLTGDYQINYNKGTRTMYIMAKDGDNGYIIPFKTFNTTCGPDTPLGNYSTFAKYDVKFMHDDIYCKYLSRFYGGFLIHSILYYGTSLELDAITYNYIDDAASGGCIRLLTGDAYWVYMNCPMHTGVHIYEDEYDQGPVEKNAIDQVIPRSQTWDPTDPASVARLAAERAAAEKAAAEGQQDTELVEALKNE